jgi:serine/threonine protein kinase
MTLDDTSSDVNDSFLSQNEKAFQQYWKKFIIWRYFPHLFACFILLYILEKISTHLPNVNEPKKLLRILFSLVILVSLPFFDIKKTKRFHHFILISSGLVLILAIYNLNYVFGRQQCFLSLYYIVLLYRIVQTRSFYDNFALCLSFSSDVSALGAGNIRWYATVNLFLWIYFWIAWLFQNVYKRNSLRIWDNIKVFLIFKGKQRKEVEKRNSLISSHFHDDILQQLFPLDTQKYQDCSALSPNSESLSSTECYGRKNVFFQGENDDDPVFSLPPSSTEDKCPLVKYALEHKILASLDYGDINIPHLKALNGLAKRNSTLIAIKIEKGESDECALTIDREQNIHQLIDNLAETYKITPIRRFGDVWIGSLGYFQKRGLCDIGQTSKSLSHPMRKGKKEFSQLILEEHKNKTENLQPGTQRNSDVATPYLEAKTSNSADNYESFVNDDESVVSNADSSGLSDDFSVSSTSLSMEDDSENNAFAHKKITEKKEMRIDKILKEQRRKRKNEKNQGTEREVHHRKDPQDKIKKLDSTPVEKKPKKITKDTRFQDMDSFCDSLNSLRFCAELQLILQRFGIKMTAAVDYGHILGGFIGSPHFDFFGQEIRWILKAVSINEFNRIFVSESIRDLFSYKLRYVDENAKRISLPEFQRVVSEYPWKKESYMSLIALSSYEKILDCLPRSGYYLLPKYHVKSVEELAYLVLSGSWLSSFGSEVTYHFTDSVETCAVEEAEHSVNSEVVQSGPVTQRPNLLFIFPLEMKDSSSATAYKYRLVEEMKDDMISSSGSTWNRDLLLMYLESLFWYEDLGIEFKATVLNRWSVDVNDDILENYSERELMTLMKLAESQLYDLIRKTCFISLFDLLFMKSQYDHEINNHFLEKKKLKSTWRSSLSSFLDAIKVEQAKEAEQVEKKFVSVDTEGTFGAPVIEFPLWLGSFRDYCFSFFPRHFARIHVLERTDDGRKEYRTNPIKGNALLSSPSSSSRSSSSTDFSCPSLFTRPSLKFYTTHSRSTSDYLQDARIFSHLNLVNLFVEFAILSSVWIALIPVFSQDYFTWKDCLFVDLFVLHCMVSRQLHKSYERIGNYVLTVIICILFAFFPCSLNRLLRDSFTKNEFGDWGGDVTLMLIFSLRIPNHMHQLPWVSAFEGIFIRLVFFTSRTIRHNCDLPISATLTTLLICFIFAMFYYIIQYRCYMSYLLEYHLVYYAAKQYELQKHNTEKIFHLFNPQLKDQHPSLSYDCRQLYRETPLVSVHLKLADIGSTLLEPKDFLKLMSLLEELINQTFESSGMLKLTSFSGVFTAINLTPSWINQDEGIGHSHSVSSDTSLVLHLLKRIQSELDRFSIEHCFNVTFGASLNFGKLYLGFLGNNLSCFDARGLTRDIAIAMASYNSENGLFISRKFEPFLSGIVPSADLLHKQLMKDERFGLYWLKFDGTVSGMQLQDFSYSGFLGKGGYGSVHLVTEKFTNVKFAVKVIVLKNSVMSRMMKRECIVLQKMQHSNVVKLQYSFLTNNRLYLVMKYITGGNLKQVIERDQPNLLQLRVWFAELILAIEYIHSEGILHRDIKPANCMIGGKAFAELVFIFFLIFSNSLEKGHLLLADFGLSKSINRVAVSSNVVQQSSIHEPLHKLCRFFPLKSHLTAGNKARSSTVTSLVINSSLTTKSDDKRSFRTFSVDVIFTNKLGADSVLPNVNIDSVFIELNTTDNVEDICNVIKDIRHMSRNTTPVYVLKVLNLQRREFYDSGAEDCFEKSFVELEEEELASIHNIVSSGSLTGLYEVENGHNSPITTARSTGTSGADGGNSKESIISSTSKCSSGAATNISNLEHSVINSSVVSSSHSIVSLNTPRTVSTAGHAHKYSVPLEIDQTASKVEDAEEKADKNLSDSEDRANIVGTIHFIAPEILKTHNYSVSSDWWAAGITFYNCITKKHVFSGEDRQAIFNNIKSQPVDLSALDNYNDLSPTGIKSLLATFLQRDIRQRYGKIPVLDMKNHIFFEGIPWENLEEYTLNRLAPKPFPLKKFNLADKATFYGDTTSAINGNNGGDNNENGTKVAPFNYYHAELFRKISHNKMKMEMRNTFLLSRYKKNRKRLSDYRRKRIQHFSIKNYKKQKQEKAEEYHKTHSSSSNSASGNQEYLSIGLEIDPFMLSSNTNRCSGNVYSMYENYYGLDYYSRRNTEPTSSFQDSSFHESFSESERSDSSFYSDKTIEEEENEDESEDTVGNSHSQNNNSASLLMESMNSNYSSGKPRRQRKETNLGTNTNSGSLNDSTDTKNKAKTNSNSSGRSGPSNKSSSTSDSGERRSGSSENNSGGMVYSFENRSDSEHSSEKQQNSGETGNEIGHQINSEELKRQRVIDLEASVEKEEIDNDKSMSVSLH